MGKRTGAWEGFDGWMLGRPHRMVPPEDAVMVSLVKKGKVHAGEEESFVWENSGLF